MLRVTAIAALFVTLFTQAAGAQVYTGALTDAQIAEAIKVGQDDRMLDTYLKASGGGLFLIDAFGHYTTPFLRVAAAARDAKRNYRAFTAADVTPPLVEPVLHVYAYPRASSRPTVFNVTQVVIVPRKGNEAQKRAGAIMPLRLDPLPVAYANWFGAKFEGEGKLAVFPLEALAENHEVRVVYDGDFEYKDRFRLSTPSGKRVLH